MSATGKMKVSFAKFILLVEYEKHRLRPASENLNCRTNSVHGTLTDLNNVSGLEKTCIISPKNGVTANTNLVGSQSHSRSDLHGPI